MARTGSHLFVAVGTIMSVTVCKHVCGGAHRAAGDGCA